MNNMSKDKEIRGISYRAKLDEESRRVEGYALLFDTDSKPMWGGDLIERISPTALDGVLEKSDVLCLMNHDERRGVLARYRMGEGSLSLMVDEKGLRYSFDAPHSSLGDELVESLKRGDISESSFAFTVEKEAWDRRDDGTYLRTILRFGRIYDVSPVYYPAYEDTSVALRSMERLEKEYHDKAEVERRANEIEFENYINDLKNKYL